MPFYILGINAYHGDASAALVADGELVAAAEEERFNRIKHCAGFPGRAAAYCLKQGGIDISRVNAIAVSRKPTAHLFKKLLKKYLKPGFRNRLAPHLKKVIKIKSTKESMARNLSVGTGDIHARVYNIEHHLAHLASAFYVSPFQDAALLSVDGFGDFLSTMLAHGRGKEIKVLDQVEFPHSLGILYTAVTQYLGFPRYGDEGKVMGLAPYGSPRFKREFEDIVQLRGNGLFQLNLKYFTHHAEGVEMAWESGYPVIGKIYSESLEELLGGARGKGEPLNAVHRDVAASLQDCLEKSLFHVLRGLRKRTGEKALCMAGGVALNAVFNGKILPETAFSDLYIQPAAADSGTAVGAAFYVWHSLKKRERRYVMSSAYTGPEFSDTRIEEAIKHALGENPRFTHRKCDMQGLIDQTAAYIAEGKVVGWFQGKMEIGPRALGHRSIVADPRNPEMKEILNKRIKHREPFRPFAPSILEEKLGEYFETDYPSSFMIMVYKIRPEKRDEIPAVTHVDGTGRVQSVRRNPDDSYRRLIDAFYRRTGVPVLLNTSFNENEPIVCAPEDALGCFLKTRMDVLAMGRHLLLRNRMEPQGTGEK